MPGCMVSVTTASFCSVEYRRRRATPVITSSLENLSDIDVCLGLSLGPPANAGVRSKRGAVQAPVATFQHGDCRSGQGRAPLLAPFAEATDVGTAAQDDRIPVETDQLGNAQAGLDAEQEQGMISPSDPRRPVRHGKQ